MKKVPDYYRIRNLPLLTVVAFLAFPIMLPYYLGKAVIDLSKDWWDALKRVLQLWR